MNIAILNHFNIYIKKYLANYILLKYYTKDKISTSLLFLLAK